MNTVEIHYRNYNERRMNEISEEDETEKLRKRKRKDMEYVWVKSDSRRF